MSNINEVNLTETLEKSFAQYAGMVIQDRAIVDVRDCMKPSARQLMWAQYIENLTYDKPFKKANKSVSAGMSHTYVHGDASAYSTLIRMGKPFAVRYPLEAVQGSYGNQIANDNEAAPRYVEMKLSELGTHLFDSIKKNTIDKEDWRDNYDGTEQYPAVLPSIGFYSIVQGSTGIGVALSSSIPQFNLREVNNALIKLLWNPDIDFNEIYCAPDFATGATIVNGSEIKESIKNGTGPSIKLRAKIEIDYDNNQLIVTELPYGVYTNTVCNQLTQAINSNPNCGIAKFLDLTGEKPLIKVTLEKNASFGKVKEFLYKNTSLQSYFSVNMTMLQDGRFPKVFGFKEALSEYLKHSKKVLRNRIIFDLNKAKDRLEIVEGYIKALSVIDEIIALIKSKSNAAAACLALMNNYGFSERQAKAILDLKLNRLVNMEILKIEQEKEKLIAEINGYNELLNDNIKFLSEIEKQLVEVAKKYGDDRRTEIIDYDENAPLVEEKLIIAYISNNGAVISKEVSDLAIQKRGRVGEKIKFSNKNDFILKTIIGKTNEKVVFFTNKGKSYIAELSELLNPSEIYINQVVDLKPDEYITNILSCEEAKKCKYVIFGTKNGIVKKTDIKEYLSSRKKTGVIAIKIKENDELIGTQLIKEDNDRVLLVSKKGNSILVEQKDFSSTGRDTMGVKGINLNKEDELVSIQIVNDKTTCILVATSQGYGKTIDINEFNICNRATKGNTLCKFKEDTDFVIGALAVDDNKSQVIINSRLSSLKVQVENISTQSRNATGVQLINTNGNNNSVKFLNLIK